MIPRSRIASYPSMWMDIARGLQEVVDPAEIAGFEEALADYVEVPRAVCTATGRAALRLGLGGLNLPEGGEVLLPAYTHPSMGEACEAVGLVPKLVDVRPEDHNVDPALVEAAVGRDTVAVIATHILGRPCDLAALSDLCERRGLVLIEDAAHAFGARFEGRGVGSWGRIAAFSFASTKPMQALGGGALVTAEPEVADWVAARVAESPEVPREVFAKRVMSVLLLQSVSVVSARSRIAGRLMRALYAADKDPLVLYRKLLKPGLSKGGADALGMSPLQGRIGARLLAAHDGRCQRRIQTEAYLLSMLGPGARTLRADPRASHVPMALTLVVESPDEVARALLQRGLDVARDLVYDCSDGACPVAAEAAAKSLHVPVYPELTRGEIERMGTILAAVLG